MNLIDFLQDYGRTMLERDLERRDRGFASRARTDALNTLDEIGELGRDGPAYIKYNPLVGVLRWVAALPSFLQAGTATGVDTGQNVTEDLCMSRSSSDRLARDLMALTNELPFTEVAPFAGLIDKATEFGNMTKRARPYLLGETLETDPDVNMLGREGKPPAVAMEGERFSSRDILPIKVAEEK